MMALQWLLRDLKSVDRCVTPWLVLLIHRPMYVVHPHKSNRIVGGTFPSPCTTHWVEGMALQRLSNSNILSVYALIARNEHAAVPGMRQVANEM